jgi:opacity protein-like surface antigen
MNIRRSLVLFVVLVLGIAFAVQPASAQKYLEDVQKWDFYSGYTHLNLYSKTVNMTQYGYNLSFGRNLKSWLALGFDFSNFNGTSAQVNSGTALAGKLPASALAGVPQTLVPAVLATNFSVPFNASSTTFAAGTQFQVRKTKWVTPFFRPFLGAFHGKALGKAAQVTTVQPAPLPEAAWQQLKTGLVAAVPQATLNKALTQDATNMGYGVGGGLDINLSKPIGVRVALDYIRTPLFGDRQNNIRVGVGLIYRFGGPALKSK